MNSGFSEGGFSEGGFSEVFFWVWSLHFPSYHLAHGLLLHSIIWNVMTLILSANRALSLRTGTLTFGGLQTPGLFCMQLVSQRCALPAYRPQRFWSPLGSCIRHPTGEGPGQRQCSSSAVHLFSVVTGPVGAEGFVPAQDSHTPNTSCSVSDMSTKTDVSFVATYFFLPLCATCCSNRETQKLLHFLSTK